MSDKIIINNDPNGTIEKPNTGELSMQIIGNKMTVKRTATRIELMSMMSFLIDNDEVFRDVFYDLIDNMGYIMPTRL